jgi:dTDP-4-dehydrorhamnose 3,5-epimerase-like enzyme
MVDIKQISIHDDRGILHSFDITKLPFIIRRIFYIDGIKKGVKRGGHGHKICQQYFICLEGTIFVKTIDIKTKEQKCTILSKNEGLYIGTYKWAEQEYLQDNSILLCLCSEEYDKDDYITEW